MLKEGGYSDPLTGSGDESPIQGRGLVEKNRKNRKDRKKEREVPMMMS